MARHSISEYPVFVGEGTGGGGLRGLEAVVGEGAFGGDTGGN